MKRIFTFVCVMLLGFSWLHVHGDTLTKAQNNIYIATFNVYILGGVDEKYKDIEDWKVNVDEVIPTRIANLAKVIAVGGFHLVAIQEVRSGARGYFAIKDLQQALKKNHNLTYRFFISGYIGRGLVPESMAFLYQPQIVRYKRVGNHRSANIEIPGRDLVKTQWVAGNFDFTLISAHLVWGNKKHRNAGFEKIKDIFNNPSTYSSDPDIIVLGDFNRFGNKFDSVKKLVYDSSKFLVPNVTFFDPTFNSIKEVTKSSIQGKGVPNDNPQWLSTTVAKNTMVYDMIIMSADSAEEFPASSTQAKFTIDFGIIHFDEPGGFGFQTGADQLSGNALKEAYSDHRPLWIRFKTDGNTYDKTWD